MPVRRTAVVTAGALAAAAVALLPSTLSRGVRRPRRRASPGGWFERLATYPVFQNVPAGVDPADETVAEISTVTEDGQTLIYTDAARPAHRVPRHQRPDRARGRRHPRPGRARSTPTTSRPRSPSSATTCSSWSTAPAATSPNPSGRLDIVDLADRTRVRSIDLGGQPDSIAVSTDGAYAAIAMENQRDEDAEPDRRRRGGRPAAGPGRLRAGPRPAERGRPGRLDRTARDARRRGARGAGLDTPEDAEPEYVDINATTSSR